MIDAAEVSAPEIVTPAQPMSPEVDVEPFADGRPTTLQGIIDKLDTFLGKVNDVTSTKKGTILSSAAIIGSTGASMLAGPEVAAIAAPALGLMGGALLGLNYEFGKKIEQVVSPNKEFRHPHVINALSGAAAMLTTVADISLLTENSPWSQAANMLDDTSMGILGLANMVRGKLHV